MVVELIIGALAAIGGSLVPAWVNRQNTKDKIRAETERRRGDYFLKQKVEVLMEVHGVLKEARREYKKKGDAAQAGAISQEDYDKIRRIYRKYEDAMDRASVFLSEEQQNALLEVFDKLGKLNGFLYTNIDNQILADHSKFGLSEFNNQFNTAEKMLQEEIKEPVEALESDHSHTS
jgi:hypothetical protein